MFEKLWDLSFSFWQIGSFSIGGGYAIITLIEDLLVNRYHWLTMKEYTDIITISQMTPDRWPLTLQVLWALRLQDFLVPWQQHSVVFSPGFSSRSAVFISFAATEIRKLSWRFCGG